MGNERRRQVAFAVVILGIIVAGLLAYLLIQYSHKTLYGPFYVVDGDTVKKDGVSYRFKYIDAPEMHRQKPWVLELTGKNSSCLHGYAEEAKNFVEKHISRVEFWVFERGKYGRVLADAYDKNGGYLEWELVEDGLAICYYREPDVFDANKALCLQYEAEAREAQRGLWSCS